MRLVGWWCCRCRVLGRGLVGCGVLVDAGCWLAAATLGWQAHAVLMRLRRAATDRAHLTPLLRPAPLRPQVNAERAEKKGVAVVDEGKGEHTVFHGKEQQDYQGGCCVAMCRAVPRCAVLGAPFEERGGCCCMGRGRSLQRNHPA